MKKEFTLCMGCMQELKTGHICPKCAYDNQNWTNPARALPLRTILNGKYLIGAVIGEGGFGITYVAWDMLINSKVAIKEYFPSELATRDATFSGSNVSRKSLTLLNGANERLLYKKGLDRFVQEAEKLAKFRQLTGIVSVQDFFYENNTAYMVMEYIEGTTLRTYLQDHGEKLSVEETLQMMKPVMATLSEVHKEGIIHRDISPDNIMITRDGQLKLIDFGAARYVGGSDEKSLTVILKHGYAPEEQYRSDGKQGPWTDVYALCAVMYRMITGKVPEEPIQRMSERQDSVEKELASCRGLDVQKRKALEKGLTIKRERRCQSVRELYEALYQKKKGISVKMLAGVGISAVVLCAVIVVAAWIAAQKKGDDYPSAKNISLQEETETKNAGTMAQKKATEVSVKKQETEHLEALRSYYNQNFGEEGETAFFVDLTEDGQDELIVVRKSKEEIEDWGYLDGGIKEQIEKNEIWVMEYCEMGVEQLYYDWGMESDGSGNVEYFLVKEDGKNCLYKLQGEILKIEIMQGQSGQPRVQEVLTASNNMEPLCNGAVRISGNQIWTREKQMESCELVMEIQQFYERIWKIAEETKGIVSSSAQLHNGDEDCMAAVVVQPAENIKEREDLCSVWYWDQDGLRLAENIERPDDSWNWILQEKEYYDGDVYQFGRNEHFFVNMSNDQLKYCYENGELCRKSPDFAFQKEEDGRIVAEFWTEDGFINYVPLYYYESQYVEYGCREAGFEVLEGYENYPEILQQIKNAFQEVKEINYGYMGGDEDIVIHASDVEIVNLMESADNRYYINCQVKGEETGWIYESYFQKWGNAELEIQGSQLVINNISWGKREDHSDLGLAIYYGEGRAELPERATAMKENTEIIFESPYAGSGIPDEELWKALYIDCIEKDICGQLECTGITDDAGRYVLVFINDDSIPELFREGVCNADGGRLFTVENGQMKGIYTYSTDVYYMERENRILDSGGSMDVYYDNVYGLENGTFTKIHEGDYEVRYYSDKDRYLYYWDGRRVSEIEYMRILEEDIGKHKMVYTYDVACSAEEMLQLLQNMP